MKKGYRSRVVDGEPRTAAELDGVPVWWDREKEKKIVKRR